MKVRNQTNWDTKALRKLSLRLAKAEPILTSVGRKLLVVEFRHSRRKKYYGYCLGYGSRNNPTKARVFVPRWVDVDKLNMPLVAVIVAHEIGHAVGLRHKDMGKLPKYYPWTDAAMKFYQWASEYEAKPKEQKEKPIVVPVVEVKVDKEQKRKETIKKRREQQLAQARANALKYERAVLRASKLVRKWKIRVRVLADRIEWYRQQELVEPKTLGGGRKFREE